MEKYKPQFEEESGNMFEWQYIGQVDTEKPEYQAALRKIQEEAGGEYVNFKKAVELTKQFQPYDPLNPDKPFARDVRIALQDYLGLITEKEMDKVKFYTASKTPLDKFHGIDAFIEYAENPKIKPWQVTFDLTMNPHKKAYKADIVINGQDLPDPNLNSDEYLKEIEEIAKKVMEKIALQKIRQKKDAV